MECWLWWKKEPLFCWVQYYSDPASISLLFRFLHSPPFLCLYLKSEYPSSCVFFRKIVSYYLQPHVFPWALVPWCLSNTSDPSHCFPPLATPLLTPFLSLQPLFSWTPKLEPTYFLCLHVLPIQQKQNHEQFEVSVLLCTSVPHPQHTDVWGYKA